jgi:outer membrane lipoprotein-sorting protein
MERVPREIGFPVLTMRVHTIIAVLLACVPVPMTGQANTVPSPSAEDVIARMSARNVQREAEVGGYTGTRQYNLENRLLAKHARMVVNVTSDPNGTRHFAVVSKDGWNLGNNALRQALETESEITRPSMRPTSLVTRENYTFQMIGTAVLNGRTSFVIEIIPKRQETYLFQGRIWVDSEDYALARIEGQLAKSPSYWVRSVHFTLDYRKNGAYWFPSSVASSSDVRIFGMTEVDIQFLNYSPLCQSAGKHSNLSPLEASNVKH